MGSERSAEELSRAGDQYLGRSYEEMDCQEFVERCLQDIGIKIDLKGSNAWYRKCADEGWVGTPESCRKIFGSVPKGAFLFIHEYDGGEKKRGYNDSRGNASHIGIKTGRGKGAIHSSQSRGCVAESEFHDKTIKNGGWNQVGLWKRLTYGAAVDWVLEHMGAGREPAGDKKEEEKAMTAIARSGDGKSINIRKKKGGDLLDRVPSGSTVEILESGDEWSKVKWNGKTGWMMTEFLEADEGGIPAEDDFDTGDLDDQDGGETIMLTFTVVELAAAMPFLDHAVEQIVAKVGRG